MEWMALFVSFGSCEAEEADLQAKSQGNAGGPGSLVLA